MAFNVEYLYWKPEQSGMTYGVAPDALAFTPPAPSNKILQQRSDWSSGVRLGATREFTCCDFGVSFDWTYLNTTETNHANNEFIIATELLGVINDIAVGGTFNGGKASSAWKLNFNMFDLDFSYSLFSNCCYFIKPYIGVKGGWINQHQTIRYNNFFDVIASETVTAKIRQINNFSGAGPKLGLVAGYHLWKTLSLVGTFPALSCMAMHTIHRKIMLKNRQELSSTNPLSILAKTAFCRWCR